MPVDVLVKKGSFTDRTAQQSIPTPTEFEKCIDELRDLLKEAKIQDGSVTTEKLADEAVTTNKIATAAVKGMAKAMGAAMAAIGTATVAAGKELFNLAQETANAGDEIDKTSQKLGMSAEAYQKWDYVLGQSGVEITSMTTGMKTLTNKIDDAKNGSDKLPTVYSSFDKCKRSQNCHSAMHREKS